MKTSCWCDIYFCINANTLFSNLNHHTILFERRCTITIYKLHKQLPCVSSLYRSCISSEADVLLPFVFSMLITAAFRCVPRWKKLQLYFKQTTSKQNSQSTEKKKGMKLYISILIARHVSGMTLRKLHGPNMPSFVKWCGHASVLLIEKTYILWEINVAVSVLLVNEAWLHKR
jgi:hypothetical protein